MPHFAMPDFAAARRNMIDTQLRTYDVTSHRLLDAIESVPREAFVPGTLAELAYTDQVIAVMGEGGGAVRHMLPPMVLARMLQAADIQPGEALLDCAGGSGYGAAIAAELGAMVVAVEESEAMAATMRASLQKAGRADVEVAVAPVSAGPADSRTFDVIVVHGSTDVEPTALLDRLADGGRMVIIMGQGRAGRVLLFTRTGASFGRRAVFDAAAQRLAAFAPAPAFSF